MYELQKDGAAPPPPPVETTTQAPLGAAVPSTSHGLGISPLNRRRWQNFKSNRRGFWSLWIFLFLFFVSLFAAFLHPV
jgi:microcin C transport system permease protein